MTSDITPRAGLRAESVVKHFGSRRTPYVAVDSVDLSVTAGARIALVGQSGSGKSTLSRLLLGLEQPTSGKVTFGGVDVQELLRSPSGRRAFRSRVQFVGQDTASSFDPRFSLRDSVRSPLVRLLGMKRASADSRVDEVLDLLHLDAAWAARLPHQVSGGQRQRFAIARSLVARPSTLVCDEVVSALDVSVQGTVLNMLKAYSEAEGASLVFVSHGLPASAFIAEEMVVMYRGRIVEKGGTQRLLDHPTHPHTRDLLDSYHGALSGRPETVAA